MLWPATLYCDAVVGLLDTLVDSVHVKWSDGPQVDNLTADALVKKYFTNISECCIEGLE